MSLKNIFSRPLSERPPFLHSIGAKIILPYLILTLIVAGVGTFIVTLLVSGSLQERLNNQLLDSGRIVGEEMVAYEEQRLAVLRSVAGTQGVAPALQRQDGQALAALVPQIVINNGLDLVMLLNTEGREVYGWQQPPSPTAPGEDRFGADLSALPAVQGVLQNEINSGRDKESMLFETQGELLLVTLGPVFNGDELVGVVLVGNYVQTMLTDLTETAVARVTLYNRAGEVVGSTLGRRDDFDELALNGVDNPYQEVINQLTRVDADHSVITANAENEVLLRELEILSQAYTLAYGDWRLGRESFGFYSIALPSNFVVNAITTNRFWLGVLFSLVTVAVFGIGLVTAGSIINPLHHLVDTTVAVTQGNLGERTHIQRADEIGTLATSFDVMTETLVERNQALIKQASELETILNSIADGVVVLDENENVVKTNAAATHILADLDPVFKRAMMAGLPRIDPATMTAGQAAQRYKVGNRVFSALAAPMTSPNGEDLGTVIALRDITREAEIEHLQDGFITSISHELRTPLTAIKGFSDLLLKVPTDNLPSHFGNFVTKINNNANRLLKHINKIIDISELQSGTLAMQTEAVALQDLAEQAIETWQEDIEAAGLDLTVTLPDEAPSVLGDPKRLTWAIENLLNNACKYTPQGEIKVVLQEVQGQLQLDVQDTGVGIAAADQPHLFSRFFRANENHEATFNVDGVGLGLFITRSIIELHQGQVLFTSRRGEGSTFSLILPIHQPEPLIPEQEAQPEPEPALELA